MLKTSKREVIFVHEIDLSKFISEFYDRPYQLQQAHMLDQGSYIRCEIPSDEDEGIKEFNAWKSADATPPHHDGDGFDIGEFSWKLEWERERAPFGVALILNDLYEKGEIEAGEYVIEVWW